MSHSFLMSSFRGDSFTTAETVRAPGLSVKSSGVQCLLDSHTPSAVSGVHISPEISSSFGQSGTLGASASRSGLIVR